jgi:hypothetical protein
MIQVTHFGSGAYMRIVFRFVAWVAIALVAASCGNPMLERKYINEGAGVDLYSGDAANQIALLNQYITFICTQIGQETCIVGSQTFVQAGMNDIDQRCDGYLTWLDARRRDQTPVLAEISAIEGATHDIMAITGSSVKSLNIVTTAFSLASATYTNWNSRLLVSVNQSTVQEVVYTSQGQYRQKISTYPVPDRPTALYLLRNYLRLCMPITIEASINTSTTLVQREAPQASMQNLVVANTTPTRPAIIRNVDTPLQQFRPSPSQGQPQGQNQGQTQPNETKLGALEPKMSQKDMDKILTVLGCSGKDLGPKGSMARRSLVKFLKDNGQTLGIVVNDKDQLVENGKPKDAEILTPNTSISLREFQGTKGNCSS